ncbi:MAG: right-handed parallel beta-helix repeat-containing protein [Planctomycetota bacterium]
MEETTNLKNVLLISVFLVATTCCIAAGRTIYVDDDGPADFDNIQAAIDDSSHGDTIIVSPGTYTGEGNRDIDFLGKAITVRSIDPNDPNIVAATIIDCNGTREEPHRGFYFNAGEEANSVLAGLTITNGFSDYGGGICCEASRPTIINCTLVANSALLGVYSSFNRGGGITCRFCKLDWPSLPTNATNPRPPDGSIYVSTTTDLRWTAGIFAESHDVYFGTNNPPPFVCNQTSTIFDPGTMVTDITYYWRIDELNTLGKTIGTLWSFTTGDFPFPLLSDLPSGEIEEQSSPEILTDTSLQGPTITNCIFIDNLASDGGGMYTQESRPILNNCTFSGNWAGSYGGGMFTEGSNPILNNCNFSENFAIWQGGGVCNRYDSNTTLTDCIFSDNFVYFSGGGMYNDGSSRSNLTNCTFKDNSTYHGYMPGEGGGGFCNYHGISNLIECKFIENSSYRGGGILNLNDTNISLTGCVFIENSADSDGGGLYNVNDSNTILTDCIFIRNSAGDGGGMYNRRGSAAVTKCIFNGNSAVLGGGMYNEQSSPTLTNCLFSGNSAEDQYSGPLIIYPPVYGYGGGMYNEYCSAELINCSFTENWASGEGGAICWFYPAPPPSPPPAPVFGAVVTSGSIAETIVTSDYNASKVIYPMITNCIFWDNEDSDGSGELSQIRIDPNKTPVVINYSCIQGLTGDLGGTGNIHTDPCFMQPGFWFLLWYVFPEPEFVWYEGQYQLLPNSPCIDIGDPNYMEGLNETDLDGWPRVVNGRIDMGAYEFQGPLDSCVFYVDDDATGANNGLSWDDAFNFLQDALAEARYEDTILVAKGTYKPDQGNLFIQGDRAATFWLKKGVEIMGGYAGTGAQDPNARNIRLYKTILSGDLDGNDVQVLDPCNLIYEPTRRENSVFVVNGSGTDTTAVLDGFTITSGYGYGLYNLYSSVTVNNCTFVGNSSSYSYGAAMYNRNSSPVVTDCAFIFNSSYFYGGGMYNEVSNSVLINCVFTENYARFNGGGMHNRGSDLIMLNCIFTNNFSEDYGGGIYNFWSSPNLTNCTLNGNWAGTSGGGIFNKGSDAKLTNCILWGDTAPQGSEIYLVKYIDYMGREYPSTLDANYSDMDGWDTNIYVGDDCMLNWGNDNIDADPCFVEPGYWDVNGLWLDGDYHLLPGSPCIDVGDPNYIAGTNETDLDGNPRVIGGRIDMGAYEFQNAPPVANAGPDQIVECVCNTEGGTKVILDGTGSYDVDSDPLTYTWSGPFVESPVHGATPTVTLEGGYPGDYVITLVVNDGIDESEPNEVVITVVDTTPPQFQLSVTPTILWPPNHKMVLITPSWTVSDECDATPDVSLVGIAANEGDDTIGDGHTSNDIQIGEDGSIYLRSERSGTGNDRIYTIIYQAVDDCGNTTVRSATVSIPHDFKVLARIAAQWLWAGPGRIPEDLNGDGIVNLKDIAIFANNWIQ